MSEEGSSQAPKAAEVRAALVVDDPQATLGDVVLRLLRLGIDVFYSKDHDEAWLLAQEEAPRIHALLFSPGVGADGVANIVDCLKTHAAEVNSIGSRLDRLMVAEEALAEQLSSSSQDTRELSPELRKQLEELGYVIDDD